MLREPIMCRRCLLDCLTCACSIVREIGGASTILLKNVNGSLPLKKPRSIVLIGV